MRTVTEVDGLLRARLTGARDRLDTITAALTILFPEFETNRPTDERIVGIYDKYLRAKEEISECNRYLTKYNQSRVHGPIV